MVNEIRPYDDSECPPSPPRVLYTAEEGWLIPEKIRPADWRERMQPKADPEPPPKINLRPTARMARVVTKKEREKRRPIPKPRPLKETKRGYRRDGGYSWRRLEELTPEFILSQWAAGKSNDDMAAQLGATRGVVYKRAMAARAEDPEFAAAEAKMKTCRCGRTKYPQMSECSQCSARTGTGGTDRHDVTIELVIKMLKAGKNIRVIARELKFDRKGVQRRVHAGQAHPKFGPILKKMGTCSQCGAGKYLHAAGTLCGKCKNGAVREQ